MVLRLPDSCSNWNLEVLIFEERGKPEYPEKASWSRGENLQQTQPTYGVDAEITTQATLVGGECSHHCAGITPGRGGQGWKINFWFFNWQRWVTKESEPFFPGIFHLTTTKSTHYSQWGRLAVQKRARLEKKKQNKNKLERGKEAVAANRVSYIGLSGKRNTELFDNPPRCWPVSGNLCTYRWLKWNLESHRYWSPRMPRPMPYHHFLPPPERMKHTWEKRKSPYCLVFLVVLLVWKSILFPRILLPNKLVVACLRNYD